MNSMMVFELFIPLISANILHMIVVKYNIFPFFKFPFAERLFGPNKTYRGLFFLVLMTSILQFICNGILYDDFSIQGILLGAYLGGIYIACELPNSFLKRNIGIASGERAKNYPWLTVIADKADSTFGVCLFFTIYKELDIQYFFLLFFGAFIAHLVTSKLLQLIRLKETL